MIPGFWSVRVINGAPFVPGRIWLCDHEPGEVENKVDQPFLQGQLALDLTPPADVWEMVAFCEASPDEKAQMIAPSASEHTPSGGRRQGLEAAPLAKWRQTRARRITAAQWQAEIRWLEWAIRYRPWAPELKYREPIVRATAQLPRFI